MSVILASELTASVKLPVASKVNIFYDAVDNRLKFKDAWNNIFVIQTIGGSRTELSDANLDHGAEAIRYMLLSGSNITVTVSNPVLDKVVVLEASSSTGTEILAFQTGSNENCVLMNGSYFASGSTKNYIYFHCIDNVAPKYLITINQGI